MNLVPLETHLQVGGLLFPQLDQADFTGPFEVLVALPNSTLHVLGKTTEPVRDARGLILTPQMTLAECPALDVLLVPGGAGVNLLMQDEEVLAFIRRQAATARCLFSVCTGALVLGAAGLLKGRKATTHWASHHFLAQFGALPVNARVVEDGNVVTAAGVTSGIDAALRIVALLRGEAAAQQIQLYIQYAPEPPFQSGTPETAPPALLEAGRQALAPLVAARQAIIAQAAARL